MDAFILIWLPKLFGAWVGLSILAVFLWGLDVLDEEQALLLIVAAPAAVGWLLTVPLWGAYVLGRGLRRWMR